MKKISLKKLKKEVRIIDALLISFIIIASVLLMINYSFIKHFTIEHLLGYGFIAIFFIIFIFEFLPQFFSPDYIVLISISLGFNIYFLTLVAILGSITGSVVGHHIGYNHGFRFVSAFVEKNKLKKLLAGWKKHGKWFVLVSAIVPLPVPYFPLVFGALRMHKKDFFIWGILPRAIGLILTGIVGYYGFIEIGKWI